VQELMSALGQTRALDAAVIAVWLRVADLARDVIKKIIDVIRGKGLTGVVIDCPTMAEQVDFASPAKNC
jgi:hypothetical protein